MAAPSLLYQHTGVSIASTSVRHWKVVLGGKKTLDEIWRKKTMRRKKITVKRLRFSLMTGVLYL
jgi:hypothetical protein